MLKKLLYSMYDLNEMLLYNFNNTEVHDSIVEIEKHNFSQFNLRVLKILQDTLEKILINTDNFYKNEFEIAVENQDEALIFKRIYNQVNRYINNYIKNEDGTQPVAIYLYKYHDNNVSFLDDLGGSISVLEENMINDIDVKFLFLLIDNTMVRPQLKKNMLINSLFVNPNLDERLVNYKDNMIEQLKYEDYAYEKLDDFMKHTYDTYLYDYSLNTLKDIFYTLLTNTKISGENLKLYEIYIRSVFSGLDIETLEQLNYSFNDMNVNIMNKDGEETIRRAFRKIDTDKTLIRKIKNIR